MQDNLIGVRIMHAVGTPDCNRLLTEYLRDVAGVTTKVCLWALEGDDAVALAEVEDAASIVERTHYVASINRRTGAISHRKDHGEALKKYCPELFKR